jgi:NAD(P)-dependent dehydrogenase (short-subunit alcohol dehydrogenase family)
VVKLPRDSPEPRYHSFTTDALSRASTEELLLELRRRIIAQTNQPHSPKLQNSDTNFARAALLTGIRRLIANIFRNVTGRGRSLLAPVTDSSHSVRERPSGQDLTRVKFGRMDCIRGKTIAITGAARGIGYATAKALLARGARVVIGDRDVALQESAVADLTKLGPVSGYPLDVTDRESFATFLDKARTDGGGHIDVLINNAGVMPIGPFLDQSEQAIRSSIEVNLYGVIAGCQLALPDMIARRRGHIINIASLSGLIPVPGQVIYVGAKFGVVGLSAALADEMAPHGVEVSVVMSPFTNTELISGTKSSGPIKPVEPEEIAAAVVKTLEKPKTHVSVPAPLRFTAQAAQMLGPRGRRWLNKRLGLDTVFLDFDVNARQSYEQRARAAQGVVDGSDKR